jgi:tRNA/tmRNA/rRNA uracil-C5-methylase (TrmA/RlmC/RlmD family)
MCQSQKDAQKLIQPILPSPKTEGYRNKLEFTWGKYISKAQGIHDEYRFGFHEPASYDRIENCTYCVLASESANTLFQKIDIWARNSEIPTYDPKTHL